MDVAKKQKGHGDTSSDIAVSLKKGDGLVVIPAQSAIKRKEPINRVPVGYGLSALRLCVWLFDNCYFELCNID